ncbi:neprilysin-2-like [Daktulosphaira vitifoliae]|uniref:neprilysin-2-like n=1 Tax=Daktulosphaira vitifoliae TaxID=58002 RepID=UPI0021A9E7E6|nr:neprilysin-2-like [Daktulosphaira vitifoliae]
MGTSVICICLLCILKIVSTLSISEDSFLENPIIEDDNICVSEGCVRSAASILANVDKSINPCDDFYKFACGKFTTDAKVDDDKLAQTTYSAVNNVVIDKVRRVLEQPIQNDEPRHSKLAKQMFACCIDERKLEEHGISSLQQLLFKVGGWPVIMGSNWNELDFQWTDTIYKFRDLGMSVDYLIDISIKVNPKDTTSHIIELDRATLNMNSLYLKRGIKDKMVNSYYRYMVDIAVELGAEKQMAKAELRRVLDFEVKLARISLFQSLNEIKDFMISESNITTLTNSYPKVPWKEYINRLICRADNICVHDNQKIMVIMPSYLTGLEVLLKFTPKRVLANYLIWRAVESSVAFSNRRLRDRQLLLQEDLFGRIARGPRWVECVNVVSSVVDLAVSSMYVNNFFNLKTKKSSSKMVENLREEFYRTLTNAEWMDPITKKNALEKAEAIEEFVAYPDELLDYSIVDKYYSKVQLEDDSDYFRSVLQLIKLRCDKSFEKLHTPVNKSDWITHGQAITVNAFYNLVENSIQLPAGELFL